MSNTLIHIHWFKEKFERHPVKGDPLDDNLDEQGFRLDEKGKRIMKDVGEDWVCYSPRHSLLNSATEERVRHMKPTEKMLREDTNLKLELMQARWAQIEPAYNAWKAGQEMPDHGTPLSAWAGVTSEKAEVLRRYSVRTVEDISLMTEGQMEKIQLPNMRELKKQAIAFLAGRGASEAAQRETERDNEIAALKAQLSETNERFSAAMELLEQHTKPQEPADEVAALKAELDARGIPYHPRHGADTLRKLLAGAETSEAA